MPEDSRALDMQPVLDALDRFLLRAPGAFTGLEEDNLVSVACYLRRELTPEERAALLQRLAAE